MLPLPADAASRSPAALGCSGCRYSDDMLDSLEYEHVQVGDVSRNAAAGAAAAHACAASRAPPRRLPQLIAKVLPSREAINEVERIAKSFWREHPEKFIAIHCAYGGPGLPLCTRLPVWPSCMALQRRAYQLQRRGPWSHA